MVNNSTDINKTDNHLSPKIIKNKIEILQQKKNLTQQDFFGSVAFGQTNYIFILALCITKLKQYLNYRLVLSVLLLEIQLSTEGGFRSH